MTTPFVAQLDSLRTGVLLPVLCLLTLSCSLDRRDQVEEATRYPVPGNELPTVAICQVPDPEIPSSAFDFVKSEPTGDGDYWVHYQCKQLCEQWQQCLVPAYMDDRGELILDGRNPAVAKQALAFVVDGMGGHLAMSRDGDKSVFIHTGAGGTRYYAEPAKRLEQKSSARTVMIRWEKGYTSPIVQPPFTAPITWGWYSRTSEQATNIRELNKRVAAIMAWSHDFLSPSTMFGTLACSMGSNATFGPVLWHGLDNIVDYQLFVGGPNMWDLNAQCGRRHYSDGFCAVDGLTPCSQDSDCQNGNCAVAGPYTTIDRLFEQLPNHIHKTRACDIRASNAATPSFAAFDDSSMGFAEGADWEFDHRVDFLVNLGAKQGSNFQQGLGGDEYWALGHFPRIFNHISPASSRQWHAIPGSHHCGAMFDEALDLIIQRMAL